MGRDLWETAPARAIELAVEEVHRSDKFSENGKAEIAVRLLSVLRNWEPSLKIRCPEGATPLTKEELKALGLRGSIKMDREFWEALSPAGQADPFDAADVLCRRARSAIHFEGDVRSFRTMGISICVLRSIGNGRACDYAKGMDKKQIKVADLKVWPPAECDAPWCTCVLQAKLL